MNDSPFKDPKNEASTQDAKKDMTYEEIPEIANDSGEVVDVSKPQTSTEPESKKNMSEGSNDNNGAIPEATRIFSTQASQTPEQSDTKPASSDTPPKKPDSKKHIGTVVFVVLLFGLGVWLSMQLRSFFAPSVSDEVVVPTPAPQASVTALPEPSLTPASASAAWVTYPVTSGASGKEIPGVSYDLPGGVSAPVCDGSRCPSRGTNLPGGTRFTVAARGKGQLLPDFRGAILTDATGKEFTMQQTTIGGVYAYEYVGNFTGRTGGGYTFTAMRGVQVPVNEDLAIEFNHFAPAGITTDFEKDDELFDEIVGSFVFVSTELIVPAVLPTSATASGN